MSLASHSSLRARARSEAIVGAEMGNDNRIPGAAARERAGRARTSLEILVFVEATAARFAAAMSGGQVLAAGGGARATAHVAEGERVGTSAGKRRAKRRTEGPSTSRWGGVPQGHVR